MPVLNCAAEFGEEAEFFKGQNRVLENACDTNLIPTTPMWTECKEKGTKLIMFTSLQSENMT
jgi:hypothetical protein